LVSRNFRDKMFGPFVQYIVILPLMMKFSFETSNSSPNEKIKEEKKNDRKEVKQKKRR
jgi:hypothetical protein